ncbi:MAG: hypothetical protein JW798_11320 [Prolixibacteraceae bacterium]|nr:hypothetical protein [Prolixibacteraceae bacterium]
MEKKEAYRHILPHFQQPGQAYFVTWNLEGAVPKKALVRYTRQLVMLKSQLDVFKKNGNINGDFEIATPKNSAPDERYEKLKKEYYINRKKYIKAYDDLLDLARNIPIDLSKPQNRDVVSQSLLYWEGKKIKNIAFAIMPNHVHWVLEMLKVDHEGAPVYLQDIL